VYILQPTIHVHYSYFSFHKRSYVAGVIPAL
jgi:hypothetical protein